MNIKLKEFVRVFQNNSLLHGIERVTLLQKVIAASIAYSAPCYSAKLGDKVSIYRQEVLTPAIKLITEINELFIINTDNVLEDVKLVWEGRFETINSPIYSPKILHFHKSLYEGQPDLSNKYNYWVRLLAPVVEAYYPVKEF